MLLIDNRLNHSLLWKSFGCLKLARPLTEVKWLKVVRNYMDLDHFSGWVSATILVIYRTSGTHAITISVYKYNTSRLCMI
jgi:hypothetical protein